MNTNEDQFDSALGERLRGAFASVQADKGLADSIRADIAAAIAAERPKTRKRRLVWRLVPLAAAAAIVIAAIGLLMGPGDTDGDKRAVAELEQIHQDNLAGGPEFLRTNDPKQIQAHFKRELGFEPKIHENDASLELVGSRIAKFQGQTVANYMVRGKAGEISIIVTKADPKALGLKCDCGHDGCSCFHQGQCKDCKIVGVQIDGRSYCAVGDVPRQDLQNALALLTPDAAPPGH